MRIVILGANGFIGSHLSEQILLETDWTIDAMDLSKDKLTTCLMQERFHFRQGNIQQEMAWIEERIAVCDVVLPLVAIATPALYVQDPLRVFELDFEANLAIIRACVKQGKRLIFPSTSEVYGMCADKEFNEETSHLVMGPIHKERWIYATSKQLLDRLIYAYGRHHQLNYTLFRPFNWYGPRLDNIANPKKGGSRVLTQFIGNILRGEAIHLVDGGKQKRCFTYIADGIAALMRIIANKNNVANQQIFNIGNPNENISIRELATQLIDNVIQYFPRYGDLARQVQLVDIDSHLYYGDGYQDVSLRVPAITQARKQLAWEPQVTIKEGLHQTLVAYLA